LLRSRLIATLVLIPSLLGLLWLDVKAPVGPPGFWLCALAMIVSGLACFELLDLLQDNIVPAPRWPSLIGTELVVFAAALPELFEHPNSASHAVGRGGFVLLAMILAFLLAVGQEMYCFTGESRHSTARIGLGMFIVTYAGVLMSFLVAIRLMLPNMWGAVAIFSILCIIKVSDAGAYFTGKSLGRHKLAPILSPHKTVEGLIGGMLAACLASLLLFLVLVPCWIAGPATIGWLEALLYGATLAAVGAVGDLTESLVKRDARRKDSSGLIPGLGGVLDIVDSVLLTAPVAFLWWASGWYK